MSICLLPIASDVEAGQSEDEAAFEWRNLAVPVRSILWRALNPDRPFSLVKRTKV